MQKKVFNYYSAGNNKNYYFSLHELCQKPYVYEQLSKNKLILYKTFACSLYNLNKLKFAVIYFTSKLKEHLLFWNLSNYPIQVHYIEDIGYI